MVRHRGFSNAKRGTLVTRQSIVKQEAGVDRVMSLRIVQRMARPARWRSAIKPAMTRRMPERRNETAGSSVTSVISLGWMANWMLSRQVVPTFTAVVAECPMSQLLVFAIGQGNIALRDGVTGMHADRVDVFNRADDHDVVVAVAHEP